jgi:hypothetical protein
MLNHTTGASPYATRDIAKSLSVTGSVGSVEIKEEPLKEIGRQSRGLIQAIGLLESHADLLEAELKPILVSQAPANPSEFGGNVCSSSDLGMLLADANQRISRVTARLIDIRERSQL